MKKFIQRHKDILTVLFVVFLWRIYLAVIQMNSYRVPLRTEYLGFTQFSNFDGNYYLTLASSGYHGLDQAFFPLFPIAINVLIRLGFNPISAASLIVAASLLAFLYVLLKLVRLDFKGKVYFWVLCFYLSFPTSFFLASIYTESFFLLLTAASFYFARKKKILLASVFGGFASATRVIGILLLPALLLEVFEQQKKGKKLNFKKYLPLCIIPLGLLGYMGYLFYFYHDPLLFVHQQPQFGAGRSGGQIVLLPQVLYRYVKIFLTVSHSSLTFWISISEFLSLIVGTILLVFAYRKGIRKSYVLFSALALYFPTLSGTLSSLPRYTLAAFAIFIYLGLIRNVYIKTFLIVLGLIIEAIFAIFFLQGHFIA